jgi:chromosomal replication initiation ATPase DnaA
MSLHRTRGERIDHIIDQACLCWSVDREELLSPTRLATFTPPRAAVALALRNLVPHPVSYPRIAQIMRREDHTTIMNLAKRARELRRKSTGYAKAVNGLCSIARGEAW